MLTLMLEDDLINLKHDVERHEDAVLQDGKDIAQLKEENEQLRKCLVELVIFARTLFEFQGIDKMSPGAGRARDKMTKILGELHNQLKIDPTRS